MESIFFDVNPSLKTFTDTTSRMNDQLQRSQQKDQKKLKAAKSVPVDSTDISTEAELMGGDMMGDMDPDQFRGRRSPSYQDMKERFAEGKEEQAADKETNAGALIDVLRRGEGAAAISPPVPDGKAGVEAHPFCQPYGASEPAGPGVEAPREAETGREGAEERDRRDGIRGRPSAVMPHAEKVEISRPDHRRAKDRKPPAEEKAPAEDRAPAARASSSSLLAWDEEFIIADPRRRDTVVEEDREEAQHFETLELPEEEGLVECALSTIVDDMVVAELSPPVLHSLIRLMEPFGSRVLKVCRDFGIRIAVPEAGTPLAAYLPESLHKERYGALRAAYVPEQKLIVVGSELLEARSGTWCPLRIYVAHSFDHALGKDEFASLKSAAVLSSYSLSCGRERGHQFMDSFSSQSPVHYFARSVEYYLADGNGGVPEDREVFYDIDRSMYLYIEYLFREINREASRTFLQGPGEGLPL